jgi:hypothetical protein
MEPIPAASGNGSLDLSCCPRANVSDHLHKLVGLAATSDEPILILADGREVGLVTKRQLLRSIQGNG